MTRPWPPGPGRLRHLDDVVAVPLDGRRVLLVACDSCAGAGDLPGDRVAASPHVVGRFACRVPLLEVLALGGRPFLVVAALGVPPLPTAEAILGGVREEAALAGVPAGSLLVSTEKNIPTVGTSLGVTVLGWAARDTVRYGRARAGDLVLAVGVPRVGAEVHLDHREIADIPTLRMAAAFDGAGDVLPVGSGGMAREAEKLARRAGLCFRPSPGVPDLEKSAGPATCFLVSVPPPRLTDFLRHMAPAGRPCRVVGTLLDAAAEWRDGPAPGGLEGRPTGGVQSLRRGSDDRSAGG